jgi:hypothetical protein
LEVAALYQLTLLVETVVILYLVLLLLQAVAVVVGEHQALMVLLVVLEGALGLTILVLVQEALVHQIKAFLAAAGKIPRNVLEAVAVLAVLAIEDMRSNPVRAVPEYVH